MILFYTNAIAQRNTFCLTSNTKHLEKIYGSTLLAPFFSVLQHPTLARITETFSKMFYEIGEHIQKLSKSLISFVCACGLPSSIQPTGFQWGSSLEIEIKSNIFIKLFTSADATKCLYRSPA
jgi:hypothetical protein